MTTRQLICFHLFVFRLEFTVAYLAAVFIFGFIISCFIVCLDGLILFQASHSETKFLDCKRFPFPVLTVAASCQMLRSFVHLCDILLCGVAGNTAYWSCGEDTSRNGNVQFWACRSRNGSCICALHHAAAGATHQRALEYRLPSWELLNRTVFKLPKGRKLVNTRNTR